MLGENGAFTFYMAEGRLRRLTTAGAPDLSVAKEKLKELAKVAREGYVDATAFDPADPHFDPKSDPDAPRWIGVDIQATRKLASFVPLAEIRANKRLAKMALVQRGQRLSSAFAPSLQPASSGQPGCRRTGCVIRQSGPVAQLSVGP